jgi:hypothetical protein
VHSDKTADAPAIHPQLIQSFDRDREPIRITAGTLNGLVIGWGIVAAQYFWPLLRARARIDALRPLLLLHSSRFVGLAFLVKGVVAPELPAAFAVPAAYGDLIASHVLHSDLLRSAASHHARACVLDFAPARYCRRRA